MARRWGILCLVVVVVACGSSRPPSAGDPAADATPPPPPPDAGSRVGGVRKVFDVSAPLGIAAGRSHMAVVSSDNTILVAHYGVPVGAPFHVSPSALTGAIAIQNTSWVDDGRSNVVFMTATEVRQCPIGTVAAPCPRAAVVATVAATGIVAASPDHYSFTERGPNAKAFRCPAADCSSPAAVGPFSAPFAMTYDGSFLYIASPAEIRAVGMGFVSGLPGIAPVTVVAGETRITGITLYGGGIAWSDDAGVLWNCETTGEPHFRAVDGRCTTPPRVVASGRGPMRGLAAVIGWAYYWIEPDSVFMCTQTSETCVPRKLATLEGAAFLAIGQRKSPPTSAPDDQFEIYVATRDAVWAVVD